MESNNFTVNTDENGEFEALLTIYQGPGIKTVTALASAGGVSQSSSGSVPEPQSTQNNTGDDPLPDSDGDGVPDNEDACPGYDDNLDADGDGTPDGCDHGISQIDVLINSGTNGAYVHQNIIIGYTGISRDYSITLPASADYSSNVINHPGGIIIGNLE